MSRRKRMLQELDQDIRDHIEMETQENIERGMSPEQARYAALRRFGNVARIKEKTREVWGSGWFEDLLQDVFYGARMLRKNPGFAIVTILTLMLGIGANTAIFSVVQGVMLAPLPYTQSDRLVIVWDNMQAIQHRTAVSYPDFRDWQRTAHSFAQMEGLNFRGLDLTSPGAPERLSGQEISSGFFDLLNAKLALGREFSPEEDRQGGMPVAIISNRLWVDRFASSPQAIGKLMTLNGVGYSIVGVLPAEFRFFDADVYIPLGQGEPVDLNDRTARGIVCIARLKSDISLSQAQREMDAIQQNLNYLYPAADRGLGASIVPLKQILVGDVGETLFLLLGAVGLILLIACANVANLLLARATARTHEFAIRGALGASRTRIVRQLITESLLLSFAGGALGLAAAKWGVSAVLATMSGSLPRTENIGISMPVLWFTLGLAVTVGILFGLAPALKSSKPDLQIALKEAGRGYARSYHRTQSSLVIVQIALTLVLLAGAGLLFRTVRHLWQVNPGFDAQNLITFKVGLPPAVTKTPPGVRIAYQQLLARIRQIPGVQAADLTTTVPMTHNINAGPFWVDSQEPASMAEASRALKYATGPDYLRVMGIPLLRGRFFNQSDTMNAPQVAVIDTQMEKAYFPNQDPLGHTITFPGYGAYRIIGVIGHVRWDMSSENAYTPYQIYASFYQLYDRYMSTMDTWTTVMVRTPLNAARVLPAIKAAVYGADSQQPVYEIHTMRQIITQSMSSQRISMILLGVFAALALLLATVGIYGVMSYLTAQRVHEIGIRMALGAERWTVCRMVIMWGSRMVIAGVALGAVAALFLARLLSSFSHLLYGVEANDPLTLVAVSFILIAAALLASYIPARRAVKVDPLVALRYE